MGGLRPLRLRIVISAHHHANHEKQPHTDCSCRPPAPGRMRQGRARRQDGRPGLRGSPLRGGRIPLPGHQERPPLYGRLREEDHRRDRPCVHLRRHPGDCRILHFDGILHHLPLEGDGTHPLSLREHGRPEELGDERGVRRRERVLDHPLLLVGLLQRHPDGREESHIGRSHHGQHQRATADG